jgi:hypothetical protein
MFINAGRGGKTYCPLEREGRIIITSTPLFAKQVSSKLAYGSARDVQRDLGENHHRKVAVSYIQRISEAVASIIEAKEAALELCPTQNGCRDQKCCHWQRMEPVCCYVTVDGEKRW